MKKFDIGRLRRSVTVYISLTIFILAGITIGTTVYIQSYRAKQLEDSFTKQVHDGINHVLEHYINNYGFRLNLLAESMDIATFIKNKDREGLYKSLNSKWSYMQKEEKNLKMMHIHLSDGSSFLRMHLPEIYGDNLLELRPIIKEVHTKKEFVHGYETGKHGTTYRIIQPIFDEHKMYVGAVEIGLNPEFVLDEIHKIAGLDGIVFIKEDVFNSFGGSKAKSIDGYQLQSELTPALHKIYRALENINSLRDDIVLKTGDKQYKVHVLSLFDFKDKEQVKIVFAQDISEWSLLGGYFLWLALASLGLIFGLLIWLIHRRIKEYENKVEDVYNIQILELQEARNLLLQSQKLAHIGNWKFDFTTNMLFWSDEVYNIFELDKKSYNPTYEGFIALVHPEDREDLQKDFEDSLVNKARFGIIHRFIMQDGTLKYLQEQCENFFDDEGKALFSVGTVQDITEAKNLENELRTSKQQFELFMQNIPASIFIKDEDGNMLYTNKATEEFFKNENLVGQKDEDILSDEQIEKVHKMDKIILQNGFIDIIENFIDENKQKHVYRLMGFSIDEEKHKKIGMVITDITQSYNDQQKLKEQEELMIAQSRHAAMGEMISMIAHQWRQPISVISMDANNILVDIELQSVEINVLKENVEDILSQTQHLSQTIDDFRDFFKPNKLRSEVLVEDVLLDAFKIIEKSFENNKIEVIKNFYSSTNVYIYARELLQVFINILKNAKEALMESEQEEKKIKISIYEEESFVIIEICDNAGGVDKSIIKSIFDPYFSTKDEKNGTGLGLYMSKIIVEKHLLGELSMANIEGGACFSVKIPKEGADDK